MGLVDYITNDDGNDVRVGVTRLSNFDSATLAAAVAEAIATQRLNTRATGDRTYHLLVSFRAGERPSKPVLDAIEDRLVGALGFEGHQRVSAVHEDTEHLHIHIAINKIHPTRLTMHEPYQAYARIAEICAALEVEYGLEPDNHTRAKRVSEDRADDITAHQGIEAFLHWGRRELIDPIRAAESWQAMHEALRLKDVSISERGNGLILVNERGERIKASSLGREFSRQRLEERLGPFQPPPADAATAGTRGQRASNGSGIHDRRPAGFRVDTSALFARYQREMNARREAKSRATPVVTAWRDRSIALERVRNQARREEIRSLKVEASERRALYSAESLRMREAIALVRERAASDLKIVGTSTQRVGWVDWLRIQAERGDGEALKALRSRSGGDTASKVNEIGSSTERASANFAVVQSVTKRGSLVMGRGIRDEGKRLVIANDASSRAVREALILAARRFGPGLIVGGTPEFRAMTIRAAVDTRLPIVFIDPALEQRRRHLLARETEAMNHEHAGRTGNTGELRIGTGRGAGGAGRGAFAVQSGSAGSVGRGADDNASSARKPDVDRIGREPPPERRNRLRDLSTLGMVRIGEGAAVLLPSDVPRDVEKQRAANANELRRTPAEVASLAAVAKYIAEREEKRRRGLSIPEHVAYVATPTALRFAGLRTVDGESLALLSEGDRVLVLPITARHAAELKGLKLASRVEVREGKVRRAMGSEEIERKPRRR